ncbi:carboxymuconolactone decarboxylase [Mycolicibacter algericus]|uniref:Carboxymuconolactone decarboxylase n=2 Tax=Mycolicibacter algericus TaxID=1288388 RepID=A0A7I9YDB3_MYCAL|nr:carboxymuconolactone decarboxylase [Mycolicibacter algericus]
MVKYENVILTSEEEQMRLAPLSQSQWDDEAVQRALAQVLTADRRNPRDAGSAMTMLVHHPKLARVFLKFNVELLYRGTLPDKLRELAILRTAHRRGCEYEWVHHITIGKEAGLTDADIEDLQHGAAGDVLHQAVLTAADELDEDSRLSPATEAILTQHLDEHQLMELVFTVGCYSMLAMAFNTFGVELDEEPESGR